MRAVIYNSYGGPDVLHIEDVEKPRPRDDEVLVRIYAVAVTRADCATRQANRNSGRGFELVSRVIFGIRPGRTPSSTTRRKTSPRTARVTTSSSTQWESTHS